MIEERILITGVSGFVGYHLLNFLCGNKENKNIIVCGIDIKTPEFSCKEFEEKLSLKCYKVNLLHSDEVEQIFDRFVPNYIVHLASYSSVAYSWKNPRESFANNTNIFLNLITTSMKYNKDCRILSVGSSEEYGIVSKEELPLLETAKLNPVSPYAVARVSQEMLSKVFTVSYGADVVLTRSFNHIGPYQDKRFAIPSFIERMLEIKRKGSKKGIIQTGDLTIIRDFVDVRDVV
ncbi:MAG: GDP-mannose 4,6-dehydratase, partial [Lachnospiraceae bacterium]|nr:GDP-mannose 4,6-dehydratase [Lachnospiraceae bacterium]